MALEQLTLETGLNKVEYAIKLLQDNEPPEGYYVADSGGKDSCVLLDIVIRSGCKFDAHYNVAPIDPPQIWEFLKEHHPDTQWDFHAKGFWKMVVKNGLPMRTARWCCRVIKEAGGIGRYVVVGNRRAESSMRSKQPDIELSRDGETTFVRPIAELTEYDVWQYIRKNKVEYCYLYDEGFKRLGCVLCPFSRETERYERYFPKIVKLWKLACNHIIEEQQVRGGLTKRGKIPKNHFETGEELYQWWIKRK